MSRLLRLGLGAVCAVVLSLSVGPPSAAASQGHREAVASSPGQTAAPSLKSAQVVVQTEASLVTVAAKHASPPVESEGAAVSAHTSVVAQVAAIEPQEEVAVAEVSPHLLQ